MKGHRTSNSHHNLHHSDVALQHISIFNNFLQQSITLVPTENSNLFPSKIPRWPYHSHHSLERINNSNVLHNCTTIFIHENIHKYKQIKTQYQLLINRLTKILHVFKQK
uniref:Uncharacterized protein n=1 Tax=Opuntia streptacantha TaxID=393608 RepID=A0A7C9DYM6_OPUST